MFRTVVLFFLLIHILGDFYFQTDLMAKEKDKYYSKLIKHALIYLAIAVVIIIPVFSFNVLIAITLLSICHWIIDSIKFYLIKTNKINEKQKLVFIVDQVLHILSIILISFFFMRKGQSIKPLSFVENIFNSINVSEYKLLCWTLLLLIIWKPTNVIIKHLLIQFKPNPHGNQQDANQQGANQQGANQQGANQQDTNKRAGAFIGVLERLIIIILLSIQQYSAIGLVLTAKSIARYNKISEDKQFAEYYLLGTLLSAVVALVSYIIIS